MDAGPVCQKSTLESSRNTAASGAILRAVICDTMNERMNDNLYIAHKKLPHKTLRVHSARYTQCIHVSSRKLKLPKDTHTKKYKQLQPTHPFPKSTNSSYPPTPSQKVQTAPTHPPLPKKYKQLQPTHPFPKRTNSSYPPTPSQKWNYTMSHPFSALRW